MEMEVMRPIAAAAATGGAVEFNFDSACTTPYISAPSSPQRFGSFFYSAPTSPTRVSTFYTPHHWEETPGIPKPNNNNTTTVDVDDDDDDFAFDFSGQLDVTTADELFDGGKIKPLKPTPPPPSPPLIPNQKQERGRERTSSSSRNKKLLGGGRSLSPLRVSDLLLDSEDIEEAKLDSDHPSSSSSSSSPSSSFAAAAHRFSTSSLSSSFVSFWYRKKWKLKDLLLFRSASDGHSMTKEQLNKYAILKQHQANEDVKNSSFRSTESCGSSSTTTSRPTPRTKGGSAVLSAHELHYRTKRAMAQDLKRKTSLPYKPAGFFGCLGFNPAADISRNFGASSTCMSREHPLSQVPIN